VLEKTEKVWFYDMQADGYSLDDKRTPIDRKGDFPDITERFRKPREGKSDR
jgi:type I restriction enzyme M protein